MILNIIDKEKAEAEAQIVCYAAEGELWTETDGESITSGGGQETRGV